MYNNRNNTSYFYGKLSDRGKSPGRISIAVQKEIEGRGTQRRECRNMPNSIRAIVLFPVSDWQSDKV